MALPATSFAAAEPYCFEEAGAEYAINPQILRAIAKVESNFNPRAFNRNDNGSYDFGVMQINTCWVPTLGLERWNTLGDPCSNIKTGAMILASCMKQYGYTWEAIGCYNSRTPDKRDRYARQVFKQLQQIERDQLLLKESLVAAVDAQVEAVAREDSPGKGSGGTVQIQSAVPFSAGALLEKAFIASEESQAFPSLQEGGVQASSQFEETTSGM